MNCEKEKALKLLKTAKGQIDGIIKMVNSDRYCVDISHQITASEKVLKKANLNILKKHLETCVKEAMLKGKEEEKIEEIMNILNKIT